MKRTADWAKPVATSRAMTRAEFLRFAARGRIPDASMRERMVNYWDRLG